MINNFISIIKEYEFSWETTIAIIGALAWIPWIYEKFTPSKLYGSIISNFTNQGTFGNRPGTLHFLKLSISCINKNYNVANCKIRIKYINNPTVYKGNIFWARSSRWIMDDQVTIRSLKIPNEEFLGFVNMLEKDKSAFYYLTFIVNKTTLEQFEKITLVFKNPKGEKKKIKFKHADLNPDQILFDDSIWQ